MAAAKTAPLSLYAEAPEEQAAVQKVLESRRRLEEALSARENQLFDPTLLAMAQGFLSPTKTGGFGESLANVAGQVGPAQAAEQKQAMELAQIRAELAAQELGMAQATRGQKTFQQLLGQVAPMGAPSAAPAAGAAPSAQPAGAQPSMAGARPLTEADIARIASIPGMEDKAKILSDMLKSQRDRFVISMQGIVFDRDTQQYLNLPIPGQKQEDFTTPYGTFKMTPYEYDQYKKAEELGQGQDWINSFRKPGGMTAGRPTVPEEAAQAAARKTTAEKTAEAETARTQEAISSGDITSRLSSYAALDAIANRKDAKEIFGIFNRPDFGSFIGTLIQENLKTPGAGSSISVPALQDAMRNLGLSQDQINRYQFALGVMANIQLQQAKLAAGQGSVSNFERDLFAQASISPRDNPETIVKKVQMLRTRAEFDRDLAKELRRSKLSLDQFKEERQEQYDKMVQDYERRVFDIASSFGRPRTQAAPGSSEASADLRRRLGL